MKLLSRVLLGVLLMTSAASWAQNSAKAKAPVQHVIAKGENLSVVARKYGVGLAEIKKANPQLTGTLAVGQTVNIPVKGGAGVGTQPGNINLPTSNSVVKMSKPAASKPGKAPAPNEKTVVHQVKAGETLMGIANRNQVTVEELQKANKLTGTNLKIGQQLVIPIKRATTVAKPSAVLLSRQVQNSARTAEKPTSNQQAMRAATTAASAPPTPLVIAPAGGPGQDEQRYFAALSNPGAGKRTFRESGIATLIEGRLPTTKMLALHRTAPIGSTLQVRNSMTGQLVNVRVIGKLPDIGLNDKVVVKLSRTAYQKLGAGDSRSLVEVNSI